MSHVLLDCFVSRDTLKIYILLYLLCLFPLCIFRNTSAHHVNIAVSVFYKSADERQDAQTGEAQHRAVILQNAHLGPDGGEAGQCR